MENREEKYWELVEKASGKELSVADKEFIQTHFNWTDFEADLEIISTAQKDEFTGESNRKTAILGYAQTKNEKRLLPMALSFAAGLALMFGLFQLFSGNGTVDAFVQTEYMVDTVYQTKTLRDTIFMKGVDRERIKYVYKKTQEQQEDYPETKAFQIKRQREVSLFNPNLVADEIKNKGQAGVQTDLVMEIPSEMNFTSPR